MNTIRILVVFGTRPEAIKFAPLIRELSAHPEEFEVITCVTAQHRSMLDQVLHFFDLKTDFDLDVMSPNQSLFQIVAKIMPGLESVIDQSKPDLIFVQGDTTTAFLGALAGYYKKTSVAHLEAGLRSGDKYAPWPEELNRVMISHLCDLQFAPTLRAEQNLYSENLKQGVHITGNTVIDALHLALSLITSDSPEIERDFLSLDLSKRFVLVTAHRRESFGEPFEHICLAIRDLAQLHPEVQFVYPVHLNPNVREPVYRILSEIQNVQLIDPLDYQRLVWLMSRCYLVLTDSGGIQEEAPALGKPVVVLRDVTERQEGIEAGTAILVGTERKLIVSEVSDLLQNTERYKAMSTAVNPYGDGTASKQIVEILRQHFNTRNDNN